MRFLLSILTILSSTLYSCENEIELDNLKVNDDSYSIILVPDTQFYFESDKSYLIYRNLFKWIKDNTNRFNIKLVLQTGDVTNTNSKAEWEKAKNGIDILNDEIPFISCIGNHDYIGNGYPESRESNFSSNLGNDTCLNSNPSTIVDYNSYKKQGENYYQLIEVGSDNLLIISLEWLPRDSVITWANEILMIYQSTPSILLTHAYLRTNGQRYNIKTDTVGNLKSYGPINEGNNDGEQIWDKLVKGSSNVKMVISGHILSPGTSFLQSLNDYNYLVNQIAFNRQYEPNGGDGWLRLLEVNPETNYVVVHTISPYLNKIMSDPENHFVIKF